MNNIIKKIEMIIDNDKINTFDKMSSSLIDLNEMEDIIGYSKYMINKQGDIWSKYYKKLITPIKNENGYLYVDIYNDLKERCKCFISRLLAIQYIPNNDPTKIEIDHIDRNRQNNNLDNLRWCNHYENSINKPLATGSIYQDRQYWKGRYSWNENGKNEICQISRLEKEEVEEWLEKIKLDHNYKHPIKSRKTIITEEDKRDAMDRHNIYKKEVYYAKEENKEHKRLKDKEYREKNKEKYNKERREKYSLDKLEKKK
jgi:hypothetical protein